MEEKTVPAFINKFPYNDMLLDGKLTVGDFGVKTGSRNWNHRGVTLLYTSLTVEPTMEEVHGYDRKKGALGAIIGAARLHDVRLLTRVEWVRMVRNFNPKGGEAVIPFDLGYFFTDTVRFKTPIVFRKSGPVRFMRVPLKLVSRALRAAGLKPE